MSENPIEDRGTGGEDVLGSPTPDQGAQRDPEEWVTGDEPMTGPQRSYLDNLARQAGEQIDASNLSKAEASEHIDRLRSQLGSDDAGPAHS